MKAIVSEKGQVTIPKALRDSLGILPGQVLDFREDCGQLVARKMRDDDDLESLRGIVDLGMTTDEYIEILRGRRSRSA